MDLDGRGDGEKWRGRENVIRMYCTKKKNYFQKKMFCQVLGDKKN